MRKMFLPLATLVLLVATVLRVWRLSTLPPGPHFDEAVNVLITRSIAFGGANHFPIVEAFQGREALYYYLSSPFFHLIANDVFTLRLVGVFANIIAIAASMALGRALFPGRRGLIIGLTVGILMALSFPQIWLSRQAFRAVTLPMMQALTLLYLWRGLNARKHGWRLLTIAGALAGATVYTYMASRLFPLWLLLGGVILLIVDRRNWRERLRQGALFFAVMGLAALPMALFALSNPDIFLGRLGEVAVEGGTGLNAPGAATQVAESIRTQLGESVRLHLQMFFIHGEDYLRYNVPGRPYLTWPEGLLMLLGIALALSRLFHAGRATERAAYGLMLLAPFMVLPSVVAVSGLPPNHMRSVAMVPLIFVLAAVGFETLFDRTLKSNARFGAQRALAVTVVAVLVIGGGLVGREYFAWAQRADLYYEADADLALAGEWLSGAVDSDELVYVAAQHRGHPSLAIETLTPVTWLGTTSLFLPPPGRAGLVLFPRSASPPEDWRDWLAPATVNNLPLGPDGRAAFEAFRLSADKILPFSDSLPEAPVRNQWMTLVGIKTPLLLPATRGDVVMHWRIDKPPEFPDLMPIVQMQDDLGNIFYRGEAHLVETNRWREGEILLQRIEVRAPVGLPPGQYDLQVAWVARESETYLPYRSEQGQQQGVFSRVGALEVIRPNQFPPATELPILHRQAFDVAPGVRLLGWNPAPESLRPGETLPLTLFWQGTETDERRAAIFAQAVLRGADSETLLWSGQPLRGRHPSDRWLDGELVLDAVRWVLPREQPAGVYTLLLKSGEVAVELGEVEISGLPRRFDAPEVATAMAVNFGNAVQLHGYTLRQEEHDLRLCLVWQSRELLEQDYTVFLHVVAQDGTIIAQRDVGPVNNSYPTSLWSAGEYVVDEHTLTDLPDGDYDIRVGLYLAADGSRLPLVGTAGTPGSDFIQLETIKIP